MTRCTYLFIVSVESKKVRIVVFLFPLNEFYIYRENGFNSLELLHHHVSTADQDGHTKHWL